MTLEILGNDWRIVDKTQSQRDYEEMINQLSFFPDSEMTQEDGDNEEDIPTD